MKEIYILGTKVNDISLKEAIQTIADFLISGHKGYIVTPNPEICLKGYNSKAYRRVLNNSLLSIPDGFGLKIGAFIFGNKLNHHITGVDLSQEIIKLAEQKNYSVLILGGTEETGERVISLCNFKFPKLQINYLNGGYFNEQGTSDQKDLIDRINELKPYIILTCLGAPKQENFMANNLERLDTKIMIGTGGTIDFLGDQIKRAPKSWRKIGLEWLWRLIQEPWRWRRICRAVIIFPLACLNWHFANYFIYRKNVAAMIINKDKKILICLSNKFNYWQMPQGGVKKHELLEHAVLREASDEIGSNKLEILTHIKNCHKYKFTNKLNNIYKYTGQKQSLFLLKFTGQNQELKPSAEFNQFKWVDKNDIINLVDPFKQKIIQIGLDKFKDYL